MPSIASVLAEQAEVLFETGDDAGLLDLARHHWPENNEEPLPSGIAEVCRFARLASCRLLDAAAAVNDPAVRGYLAQRDLWEAHGLTAAVLAGDRHVVAGFLLPRVFALIRNGAHADARRVIDDMWRLIDDSANHQPFAKVLRRLCHEKSAYSYFAERRFDEAIQSYEQALTYTNPGARGQMKVRGGLALARYMASDRGAESGDRLRGELTSVAEAAARQYPDVANSAQANLRLLDHGQTDQWVAFELL